MSDLLSSELFMNMLAVVVGGIWTAIKASEWMQSKKDSALYSIADALEQGVQLVYETYVRETKAANADGKLTEQERMAARNKAIDAAGKWLQDESPLALTYFNRMAAEKLHAMVDLAVQQAKLARITGKNTPES